MGKKKAKVKWTAVNSVPFNYSSDSGLVSPKQKYRGSDTFTANSTLPPRFERKTIQEKNLVYYDGQFCETEELPNGFVKVRSKHLDVLFKRDFYTKKIERIFKSGSQPPLNSTLSEAKEEMLPYNCHNSSDGSIIYNIDHLLVSSNFSFEGSANATANPSRNVSLENEDNVDNISMAINNVIEEQHAQEIEDSEEPGFVDNPEDRVRHDSGFVDSSMNLPSDNSMTEPHVENLFLPSTPSVYVYIPSKNSLIPCKEVFVSPPTPRDPRCTCAPATSIFLTGQEQGNSEHLQVVQHAPPGFVHGPPPLWAGNMQHSFTNGEQFYPNMIPVDHHQVHHHMMSCAPFGPNHSFNPYHVPPHLNPYVEPFAPVVEDLNVHPGDGNGPLSTSELANASTEENTYQLFPADKKLHPLFEYSCSTSAPAAGNDDVKAYAQQGQHISPRKVIEPDYDWMAQQEDSFKELQLKNVVHQSVKSAPCNMGSPFKSEVFVPQEYAQPLKSSIPGLSVESHTGKKPQKKKRRKKRKGSTEKKNVYSSDETVGGVEPTPHSSCLHKIQGCTFQSSSDMDSDKLESLFEARSMEQSHEVELSDALASSLVDPLAELIANDAEKESLQEVLVDSVAALIFDVVDVNDVHEAFKNKSEQVVSKKNKKDENLPQMKVLDKALMPVVGCAITATDGIGQIVEELISAAFKHSDEAREAQDKDLRENKISSALHIEMDSKARKQVKDVKDESLQIMELKVNRAKENIEVELLDSSRSKQDSTLKSVENIFKVKNNGQIKPTNPLLLPSSKEVKQKASKSKNVQPTTQGDKMALVEKRNKKYRKKDLFKSEPVHRVMINDSELEMLWPTQPFGQFSSVIVESLGENLNIEQQKNRAHFSF